MQVLLDEESGGAWRPVSVPPAGSAVLLFGWCANVRSNDRVPAALHRVVDADPGINMHMTSTRGLLDPLPSNFLQLTIPSSVSHRLSVWCEVQMRKRAI